MEPSPPAGTDVTVWCVPPLPAGSGAEDLLSRAEAARATTYRRAEDRDRFTTARAVVRAVLGEALGLPARDVELRTGVLDDPARGRPVVPGGPSFSISHAGSWVLVAVVAGPRGAAVHVGVDVESTRTARQHLDHLVGALPPEERPTGGWTPESFTRSWVRREAVLKAVGTGLLTPRDDLLLSPADAAPAVVRTSGGVPAPRHLTVQDLDLPSSAGAGALAPAGGSAGGSAPPPPFYLAALALCSPGPEPAALSTVVTADGLPLLARHGVQAPASLP